MGSLIVDVVVDLSKRNTGRTATLNHINLRMAELDARKQFHQDPTPANLTAWCDANDAVEAAR
jgi:hypothetical protein